MGDAAHPPPPPHKGQRHTAPRHDLALPAPPPTLAVLVGLRRVLLGGVAAILLLLLLRCANTWGRASGAGGGRPYVTHELRLAAAGALRCVQERAVAPGSGVSVIGARAPPGSTADTVDLSLAHHLLPLTNLSGLTTATLLDTAAANATGHGRALVRLHQDLYCR